MKTKSGKTKDKKGRKATRSALNKKPDVTTNDAAGAENFIPSREQICEAARVLRNPLSKKRERRQAASVMSHTGSRKGGLNRAQNLSPEKRREIATMGGLARQAKNRQITTP